MEKETYRKVEAVGEVVVVEDFLLVGGQQLDQVLQIRRATLPVHGRLHHRMVGRDEDALDLGPADLFPQIQNRLEPEDHGRDGGQGDVHLVLRVLAEVLRAEGHVALPVSLAVHLAAGGDVGNRTDNGRQSHGMLVAVRVPGDLDEHELRPRRPLVGLAVRSRLRDRGLAPHPRVGRVRLGEPRAVLVGAWSAKFQISNRLGSLTRFGVVTCIVKSKIIVFSSS